jgi:hypothetical protein
MSGNTVPVLESVRKRRSGAISSSSARPANDVLKTRSNPQTAQRLPLNFVLVPHSPQQDALLPMLMEALETTKCKDPMTPTFLPHHRRARTIAPIRSDQILPVPQDLWRYSTQMPRLYHLYKISSRRHRHLLHFTPTALLHPVIHVFCRPRLQLHIKF